MRNVPALAIILGALTIVSANAKAQTITGPFQPAPNQAQCLGADGYAADFGGRRTFIWRPEWLNQIKEESSRRAVQTRNQLVAKANRALSQAPLSVTSKTKTPQSGDKHDYYSMGPYWWPDATKPNGEPYVRRDGVVNPQRNGDGFDATKLSKLSDDVSTLALAHFYTGDVRYAQKAAQMIKVWFLEPATKMNPSFAYAQAVPGVSAGRGEGIIDANRLLPIVESIGLLGPSGVLTPEENTALEKWFAEMALWMATSPNGQEERGKNNNHGIFYDLIISEFALFAREPQAAADIVRAFPQIRIAVQFGQDGSLPEELSRTRSWHYSHWTLGAVSKLAGLGECVGLDLWRTNLPDGRGLAKGLSFMSRYVSREASWTYPESAFQPGGNIASTREIAFETFRLAGWGYRNKSYEGLAQFYANQVPNAEEHAWLSGFNGP
jgi:hypothetical protein